MPTYDVTVTRTVMESISLEISAADEDAAEEKARTRIEEAKDPDKAWLKANPELDDTEYRYEVSEQ
jgi:hypothetical protein